MMNYTRIAATGSYLPQEILTNADLERIVETNDEWIVQRTGIQKRHIAAAHETVVTMGKMAAELAMQAAGVSSADIDMVLVATSTGSKIMPSAACLLQQQLGIPVGPAFDVAAACAGFVYGLSVADKFIRSGEARCVLLVGAEVMSRILDWNDRSTCVLFGDGAGAVVLVASDTPGIYNSKLYANGHYQDLLYATNPITGEQCVTTKPHAIMAGNQVFKLAVTELGNIVTELLEANNISKEQLDWLVPHQANIRIIQAIAKKLDLPTEQVIVTVNEHGNTSAASIPLALDVGIREGKIKRGDLILLEAFGAGLTWGASLIRF